MAARRRAASRSASTSSCPHEQGLNAWCDIGLTFDHFYARKVMFVKAAEGFVIFPGGFGTQDELWEALTLIQTRKIGNFPVVVFDSDFWGELLDWMRKEMLDDKLISPEDVDLLFLTDDPRRGRGARRLALRAFASRRGRPDRRNGRRRGPPDQGRDRSRARRRRRPRQWPRRARGRGRRIAIEISYDQIPGWPVSTAVGHAGVLDARDDRGRAARSDAGSRAPLRGHRRRPGGLRHAGAGAARHSHARRDERRGRDQRVVSPGNARAHLRPREPDGGLAARRAERRCARPALPGHERRVRPGAPADRPGGR